MLQKLNTLLKLALSKVSAHSSILVRPKMSKEMIKLMTFYGQFFDKGDLCFDIGANVGNRSDVFLAVGARVVCIEPQPKCINVLNKKYHNNPQVTIVPQGLAAQPGVMSLSLCESASTIATFSENWKKGRFQNYQWESSVEVPVTTMDHLIQEFGIPQFCKIDVEGFEYQVLQGLSTAIPIISFEFTREFFEGASLCMDYLSSLGKATFNYALGETRRLELGMWTDATTLVNALNRIDDNLLWGDIYVRYQSS